MHRKGRRRTDRTAAAWTSAALRALALGGALSLAGAGVLAADKDAARHEVRDPYYGAVLYQEFQDRYFTALTELMVSQHFERMPHHVEDAEIQRGSLYLSYGLHREAARIFTRLIDQGVAPAVRDRAWFYLAKIRYQRGLPAAAEDALGRVRAPLPPELETERVLLKASLQMLRQDFAGATQTLQPLATGESASLYARYNLGVAMIRSGADEPGRKLLDELGRSPVKTDEFLTLRDKANVALGFAALKDNHPERAREFLERVRLDGLLADEALLGYGWASDAMHDPRGALVAWQELAGREAGDASVLEARLAEPYALVKIGSEGLALEKYAAAIAGFDAERRRLDESIAAIRGGGLLDGLVAGNPGEEMGWFWNIERLPKMGHAAHLIPVLAAHDFQEGFKNYRDLLFLARNLRRWQTQLGVLGDMLENRRQAFAARLPLLGLQTQGARLESLEGRRAALGTELDAAAQAGDGKAFATPHERALAARIEKARAALARLDALAAASAAGALEAPPEGERKEAHARLDRVAGALGWSLGEDLPVRLWDAKKDLKQVAAELLLAHDHEQHLERAQQEEPRRFDAFAARLAELGRRVDAMLPRVDRLIAEQREAVQELAVARLVQQQQDLVAYGSEARFAVAQIYDRALARGERKDEAPPAPAAPVAPAAEPAAPSEAGRGTP
jgi:hypothetical protein